jgi:hypothetical protein
VRLDVFSPWEIRQESGKAVYYSADVLEAGSGCTEGILNFLADTNPAGAPVPLMSK